VLGITQQYDFAVVAYLISSYAIIDIELLLLNVQ